MRKCFPKSLKMFQKKDIKVEGKIKVVKDAYYKERTIKEITIDCTDEDMSYPCEIILFVDENGEILDEMRTSQIKFGVNMSLLVWGQSFISSYGYIGVFVLEFLFTASVLFPLPAEPLIVFAGALMNPFLVGLIAGLAASLGECISFLIGKAGHMTIKKKHEKKLGKIEMIFNKHGFWSLPIFAFTPLPADLVGLVAGFLKYDIKKFFLGMLIGKIPRALILAYFGYYGFELTKFFFSS